MWNRVTHDDAESDHATICESPLSDRDGDETTPAEAVLHSALEGVGARELAVDDDQPDGPIDGYGEADQKKDTHGQACLFEGVWLTDDTYTISLVAPLCDYFSPAPIIELAMFIMALAIPLFGLASGKWSSA
jgi:hypothetical protein